MCYVRKEIYLGIINLTFFLLFELLKLAAVLLVSVAYLVDSTYNPFIYFRF